jgi:plastocyanin
VQYRVTVATREHLTPVRPFWVRAGGCRDVTYPVVGDGGPGSTDIEDSDWQVPVSGRIVAVGGHLHGGAKDMFLAQPECGGRRLLDTAPRYGMPDDLYYTARPILHEPGPVDTRYFLSATGIQLRRGERLTLTGTYDSSKPHTRVMSIMHVYLAKHAAPATQDCAALPADAQQLVKDQPVRLEPPDVAVPLNMLGDDGHTHEITTLPWTVTPLGNPATVALRDNAFDPPYVRIKSGSKLTWSFDDEIDHNVTFASGPMLQGSPTLAGGKTFTTQFTRAGRYELFCYLHPLQMHQVIDVVD